VTDGEPTAHVEGRDLVLGYPPSDRTSQATLQEVRRCFDARIRISTLALIEYYFYLDMKTFVDQMARMSQGIAVYCTAGELGRYVFESFARGRRSRPQVGGRERATPSRCPKSRRMKNSASSGSRRTTSSF